MILAIAAVAAPSAASGSAPNAGPTAATGSAQGPLQRTNSRHFQDATETRNDYTPTGYVIGVATFNSFRGLGPKQARADRERILSDEAVDLIGWQESDNHAAQLDSLSEKYGWRTLFGGNNALAFSYRLDEFQLNRLSVTRMHDGCGPNGSPCGDVPFGPRYVMRIDLTIKATGRSLTVLNTHVNSYIEDWAEGHPGTPTNTNNAYYAQIHLKKLEPMWSASGSRYTLGTGDYNWDARVDQKKKLRGWPAQRFADDATNNWQIFGFDQAEPTHPDTDRFIDYVWESKKAASAITYISQTVMGGFYSDHRPVLVQMDLN